MSQALRSVDEATSGWLTGVLRQRGALTSGAVESVSVRRVHSDQLHSLGYFLDVAYADEAPASAPRRLFLKLPRPEAGRSVIAGSGAHEVRMYQALLGDQHELPVIPCFDAVYDDEPPAYHLLLADLSESHDQPAHYLSIADRYIEQTVDSLARFHAWWWEHPRLNHAAGGLPDAASLPAECDRLRDAYPAFANLLGEALSPEDRRIYESVLAALPALLSRHAEERGQTMVHGDAHFWNFLYPRDPNTGHTCIIDWQSYRAGRGAHDLAYTIVLRYPHRTPTTEVALVRRYYDRLIKHGVAGFDWDTCWDDYRRAAAEHVLASLRWWSRGTPESFWRLFIKHPLSAYHELACDDVLG
jgi:hypothetical protein